MKRRLCHRTNATGRSTILTARKSALSISNLRDQPQMRVSRPSGRSTQLRQPTISLTSGGVGLVSVVLKEDVFAKRNRDAKRNLFSRGNANAGKGHHETH